MEKPDQSTVLPALSTLAGVLAAVAMKTVIGKLWRGDPPKDPSHRSVSWPDALQWTVVASLGAGVARLVARRATASGWEKATGDLPSGFERS